MKKEVYLVIIATTQYWSESNKDGYFENFEVKRSVTQNNVSGAFSKYDDAVAYVNSLVESQKVLEPTAEFSFYGANREDLFEKAKTNVYGWPFEKVLYGVETKTHYNSKETLVMERFIVKQNIL